MCGKHVELLQQIKLAHLNPWLEEVAPVSPDPSLSLLPTTSYISSLRSSSIQLSGLTAIPAKYLGILIDQNPYIANGQTIFRVL